MSPRIVVLDSDPGVSTLTTPGFVYFIQGADGGLIKIGWATKPMVRMANMQSHSPVKLTLLTYYRGTGKDEKALHVRFASARRHGEWFEPNSELLAHIDAIGSPPEPIEEIHKPEPPFQKTRIIGGKLVTTT